MRCLYSIGEPLAQRHCSIDNMEKQEIILSDKKPNGKERPWQKRKSQSVNVSDALIWGDAYEYMTNGYASSFKQALEDYGKYKDLIGWLGRKSDKMHDCGETLEFAVSAYDGTKKLYRAWFCKDRLCPMCNWRRSIKLREQVLKMLQAMKYKKIEDKPIEGKPIFLTLTMPNVTGDEISKSFSDYAEGFHRLMKYKKVAKVCVGAIRASEITYNSDYDNYNTHIHCLLWMTPDYFHKSYINQDKWTTLWERAVKWVPEDHINPKNGKPTHLVVDVRAVKPQTVKDDESQTVKDDEMGYINAVLEITKYIVKPTSILANFKTFGGMSDRQKMECGKQLSFLERGLYRKRLIGYFGIFKEIHKELDLDDVEDGDLIGADEDGDGTADYVARYTYDYQKHNYYLTGVGDIKKDGATVYPEDEEERPAVTRMPESDNGEKWAAYIEERRQRQQAEKETEPEHEIFCQSEPVEKSPNMLDMDFRELIDNVEKT